MDRDGLIIEDDHDAVFRWDRMPMGCLQGLDPQRIALLGSVSRSLAPGLRLGWVVRPGRCSLRSLRPNVTPMGAARSSSSTHWPG